MIFNNCKKIYAILIVQSLTIVVIFVFQACKVTIIDIELPETADTGEVIELKMSCNIDYIENDNINEYGAILQIPIDWEIINAIAYFDNDFSFTLAKNDKYAKEYIPEENNKIWVGTYSIPFNNKKYITNNQIEVSVLILTGNIEGETETSKVYTVKAGIGLSENDQWISHDPYNIYNFQDFSELTYTKLITIYKANDNIPPPQIQSIQVKDLLIGTDVLLSWQGYNEKLVGDIVRYDLYKSNSFFDNVLEEEILPFTTVPSNTYMKQITDLVENKYYFAVCAVDEKGNFIPKVQPASVELKEGVDIKGYVLHQDEPVEGITLTILDKYSGIKQKESISQKDGTYLISEIPVGEYFLIATASANSNLNAIYYNNAYSLKNATPLIVNPYSSQPNEINFEMSINKKPVADAGPNQNVTEETLVFLDGSNSVDLDGEIISYEWEQKNGNTVDFTGIFSAQQRFVTPKIGQQTKCLEFVLTVIDNNNDSDSDTCLICINKNNSKSGSDSDSSPCFINCLIMY